MGELFQTTPQNVTLHLKAIDAEGELTEGATCKESLQAREEGGRQVTRKLRQYCLPAILAVGYCLRSPRGRQFRQWFPVLPSEVIRRLPTNGQALPQHVNQPVVDPTHG